MYVYTYLANTYNHNRDNWKPVAKAKCRWPINDQAQQQLMTLSNWATRQKTTNYVCVCVCVSN